MAKKGKRTGLLVTTMYSFGRGCGKPLVGSAVSPYIQVSQRLEKLGHPRLQSESERNHCIRLKETVSAYAAGHGKKSAAYKVSHPPKQKKQPKAGYLPPAPVLVGGIDVASTEFLQTYEWRRVRMEALKKYGPVCQCCGATPKTGAVMNVDHIKPRKLFPQLAMDVSNLQILCHECNHGKGNWDQTDWRSAA